MAANGPAIPPKVPSFWQTVGCNRNTQSSTFRTVLAKSIFPVTAVMGGVGVVLMISAVSVYAGASSEGVAPEDRKKDREHAQYLAIVAFILWALSTVFALLWWFICTNKKE